MKEISSELLAEITRRLVAEFHPEQIILFGSHAWGQPTEDSDLDFLVIVSKTTGSRTEMAGRGHRAMGEIPAAVDILVKTRSDVERYRYVHASLTAEILERGKILYG